MRIWTPPLFCALLVVSLGPVSAAPVATVTPLVEALPEQTPAEKIKKSALRVAVEQASAAESAGETGFVETLVVDIQKALTLPATTMAAPNSSAKNISVLQPLRTVEGNPYLKTLAEGATREMEKGDLVWAKNTPTDNVFEKMPAVESSARVTAARMEAYLWLFANPGSPLYQNENVLARFLGRALAYADAINVHGSTKAGALMFDDFAIAPAVLAIREFARLYPGLLLPSQQASLDSAMKIAGAKIMAHSDNQAIKHAKGYPNIDLSIAFELLNLGLYLDDPEIVARSKKILHRFAEDILPDGGSHYIWSQNESAGYHDVVASLLARTYEIDGDPKALAMLKSLEWYGPISIGRQGEYWTAPSWKHTWNSALQGIVGGEYVIGATGNPLLRGMLGGPDADPRKWFYARPPMPWYRGDIVAQPLPDNVTYPDRNIVGPRSWYGRFSYAATLRDIPTDEPGHATIMGALTTTKDLTMQAFVMGIYPRVLLADKREDPRSWAWLTSGLQSSQIVARQFSVVSGSYELSTFNSATVGTLSGWMGRQLWLGLPDRIVGRIEVAPGPDAKQALDLQGIVRLGTGGTVSGGHQIIREIAPMTWQYGDLVVRVWDQNFASVEPVDVPFRLPQFPVTELTLTAGNAQSPASFLVEIRPSWAVPAEAIALLDPYGLSGLRVAFGGKHFTALSNPTGTPVALPAGKGTLFVSGSHEPRTAAAHDLLPGQCAVFVDSPDTADLAAGVNSYHDLVKPFPPAP